MNEIYEMISRKFILSWSLDIKLMRIEIPDELSFYEIDFKNGHSERFLL